MLTNLDSAAECVRLCKVLERACFYLPSFIGNVSYCNYGRNMFRAVGWAFRTEYTELGLSREGGYAQCL